MYIVMLVLDDPNQLDNILDAWDEIGIRGVTIHESTGVHRRRAQRKHIPMRFSFAPIVVGGEEGNYTLFTIVKDRQIVEKCITITESIIGNFDDPNTGILAAWPIDIIRGVNFSEENN